MRELERERAADCPSPPSLAIVGRGRLGGAMGEALRAASCRVIGPLGRGRHDFGDVDAVLLCVPDGEISSAAAAVPPGPLVGHCSGATDLKALAPHEAFSLHPLMTVTPAGARCTDAATQAGARCTSTATPGGARFTGAGAAIAGSTERALAFAHRLAAALGMRPLQIADADRAVYHAAASIASNFLVTLEAAAERLAANAGVERELLIPLVRATVENWGSLGPRTALTGPVARGDEETISRQRSAIAERAADLLPLFDALVQATRALACPPPTVPA